MVMYTQSIRFDTDSHCPIAQGQNGDKIGLRRQYYRLLQKSNHV